VLLWRDNLRAPRTVKTRVSRKTIDVGTVIFVITFLKKYRARPGRKFLNSSKKHPPLKLTNQVFNLPAPFPIRTPLAFLVKGMWGNMLNHTRRLVRSDFLTARFRKTFSLKIRFAEIRTGRRTRSPQSP
jgi:hypothetical protein|tara:strand:- start:4055 stop:4441 length:387 start_codon:yes stop_codon:yes gene_type:complete